MSLELVCVSCSFLGLLYFQSVSVLVGRGAVKPILGREEDFQRFRNKAMGDKVPVFLINRPSEYDLPSDSYWRSYYKTRSISNTGTWFPIALFLNLSKSSSRPKTGSPTPFRSQEQKPVFFFYLPFVTRRALTTLGGFWTVSEGWIAGQSPGFDRRSSDKE